MTVSYTQNAVGFRRGRLYNVVIASVTTTASAFT
jgi:hypothetical protein